jgi:hypothetical protein
MGRFNFAVVLVGLLVTAVGQATADPGPLSPYYVTDGFNTNRIYVLQGTSVVNSFAEAHGAEYSIAVASDVRTIGYPAVGSLGANYTLGGTYTGVDYAAPLAFTYDGTTDGAHNYMIDYLSGDVYQTARDWSSPVKIFNTGFGGSNALGITYDPTNNSLWISQWLGTEVADFTLGGTLLSSFAGPGASMTSLGLDPADNTLWMGTQLSGTYFQFSKGGTLLQSVNYPSLVGLDILGGEFAEAPQNPVPEPSSFVLLGIAIAGIIGYHRRRNLIAA